MSDGKYRYKIMVLILDGNLENRCAGKEQSLLSVFDQEQLKIEFFFHRKKLFSFKRSQYVLSYHHKYHAQGMLLTQFDIFPFVKLAASMVWFRFTG